MILLQFYLGWDYKRRPDAAFCGVSRKFSLVIVIVVSEAVGTQYLHVCTACVHRMCVLDVSTACVFWTRVPHVCSGCVHRMCVLDVCTGGPEGIAALLQCGSRVPVSFWVWRWQCRGRGVSDLVPQRITDDQSMKHCLAFRVASALSLG